MKPVLLLYFHFILKAVLEEYPVIFWMDASIRFINNNLLNLTRALRSSMGLMLFSNSGISNFQVTHSELYQFIPTDNEKMKSTSQYAAGCLLLANTKPVYENILKWLYACSSDKACTDFPGARLACHYKGGRSVWAKCHRYDQSMINILLLNWHRFNVTRFTGANTFFRIHRGPENVRITTCKVRGPRYIETSTDNAIGQ